jgi:hypothetical protein
MLDRATTIPRHSRANILQGTAATARNSDKRFGKVDPQYVSLWVLPPNRNRGFTGTASDIEQPAKWHRVDPINQNGCQPRKAAIGSSIIPRPTLADLALPIIWIAYHRLIGIIFAEPSRIMPISCSADLTPTRCPCKIFKRIDDVD